MGFYGSLMDIFDQKTVIHDKNNFCLIHEHYDQKNREAQKNISRTFFVSLMLLDIQ